MFLKQDGTWRYHKSCAFSKPVDFTPLLDVKDLTARLEAPSEQDTEQNAPRPKIVPVDHPLSGRLFGKQWRGLFACKALCNYDAKKDYYRLEIHEKEVVTIADHFGHAQMFVTMPKKPGDYKASKEIEITFFDPPDNTKHATNGTLKVSLDGATYTVELVADADKDNDVQGKFTFTPSSPKKTK